jgi:hypothetical protein
VPVIIKVDRHPAVRLIQWELQEHPTSNALGIVKFLMYTQLASLADNIGGHAALCVLKHQSQLVTVDLRGYGPDGSQFVGCF